MATAEGRKQLTASCNCAPAAAVRERKQEAGKQELAQQNPPAPRPLLASSSLSITAENGASSSTRPPGQWGVSGATTQCHYSQSTALVPSRRRRRKRMRREEALAGCFPALLQVSSSCMRHRQMEPQPWAAPLHTKQQPHSEDLGGTGSSLSPV